MIATLHRITLIAGLGLSMVLTGCGTPSENDRAQVMTKLLREQVTQRRARRNPPPALTITRAMLAGVKDPFLSAELEQGGFKATLFVTAESGPHMTWKTLDNVTLSTRAGALVSTRGLPYDLMSSDPAPVLAALTNAPAEIRREMRWLRGDNTADVRHYDCALEDQGTTRIVVLERSHTTRHLVETCAPVPGAAPLGEKRSSFTNEYWVAQGTIWRQRVWLGPNLGHIRMDRLIR